MRDGSDNIVSRSEFLYDGVTTSPVNGNLTETRVWDNTKGALASPDANGFRLNGGNSVSTTAVYDQYGNVTQTTDANNTVTQITYGDVAGPNGNVTGLYPTQTIAAHGTPLARTSTAVYDFYTGLPTSATDVDNGVTNATEYDALGRPTKAISALGVTGLESWTQTEYDDINRRVIVRSDLSTKGDGKKVAVQFFDQLGRVRLAKALEDAATQSATNETDGIKVQTRYKVTGFPCPWDEEETCSGQLVSNPFRADTAAEATAEETMGWTLSLAENNGRYSQVETIAGAGLPAAFGGSNSNSTGKVITEIDANTTTVEDQAGKKRRSITNALGQLIRVDEPNGAGELGSVSSPNQATSYAYDTLNNLTTVTQGVQTRSFTYSSLSRLLTAANPESGTIGYEYDPNGNLTEKTDARSIVTTYTYDELNRVTARDYSDTTPDVDYTYGTSAPKVGKLVKVESSVSTTEYTGFDILGRVTAHKQTTDGQSYTTGYVYNLSGALIEQAYPSGRVVKNVLDNNGDLSLVQSKKNSAYGFFTYANSFTYNPAGAVTSMQLGNGRWESTQFNSRLQPTQIALGVTQGATNLLDLDYSYGTAANNGNVLSQTITVPTVGTNTGFSAVQTYNYDSLNRLKDATEMLTPHGGSQSQSWKQTFSFDRYGNRNFDEANTAFAGFDKLCNNNTELCADLRKRLNPSINASNNRLSTSNDYDFDESGNTTEDPDGRTFVYDAENKQVSVSDTNGTIGDYWYDGDGKRVKKHVPSTGEVTVFVYDAGGKLIGEYSTIVETQSPKVSYTTADHLGSPRILTDENGATISRRDFMPYGEEIARTGYGSDTVRQKFTGYERDIEIDLDFAQARYFSYNQGRFTSPDDFGNDTYVADPQSWNLYVYVRNNPLKYIDPTGEEIWISFQEEEEYEENGEKKKRTVTRRVQYRNGALYNQDGSDYTGNNQYALNARDYLNTLSQDGELRQMIRDLDRSRKVHTIMRNPDDPSENRVDLARNGTTVYWTGEQASYEDDRGNKIPVAAIFTLAHELLGHSWFIDRGRERQGAEMVFLGRTSTGHIAHSLVARGEIDAVSVENIARRLFGKRERLFVQQTDISEYLVDSFLSPRRPPKLKVAPVRSPK